MDIRLIAFDMDDTLLGADGEFPRINVRALRACAERGIFLALNSGRSFETLRDFACALGTSPFIISVNGARVDEGPDGPTILERVYDGTHTRAVYEAVRASGLYYTVYTRGHTYMGNSAQRFLYSRFDHHYAHVTRSGPFVYEMVDDEERLRAEGLNRPYKFVALGTEHDARFQEILGRIAPLHMSVSSSRADNLEVMMPGVDKGSALKFLAERLGVSPAQVMAFGDNTNDLPMLSYAGASVAMANGEERVRRAARFVAPHHAEGGVGKFLFEKVLV
ncbi:MAG TPA: HAD family hydrolase [Candidatus Pullichristensenella avicola]|nr:HAD family hydrolase [Candidatus Pullichristensenella avicola]